MHLTNYHQLLSHATLTKSRPILAFSCFLSCFLLYLVLCLNQQPGIPLNEPHSVVFCLNPSMFLGLRVRFHSCMVVHCAEDGRRVRHRSIFPSLVLLVSDGLYIYHTPALTSYLSFFFFFFPSVLRGFWMYLDQLFFCICLCFCFWMAWHWIRGIYYVPTYSSLQQ